MIERWIFCPSPWWPRWAANLRSSHLQPGTGFFIMGAPRWAASEIPDVLAACADARSLGYAVVPGMGHMLDQTKFGHNSVEAWFLPDVWALTVSWLEAFKAAGYDQFCLDVEPYFEASVQYPPLSRYLDLSEALRPVVDALGQRDLFLLPGAQEYLAWYVLRQTSRANLIACAETTYDSAPADGYALAARYRAQGTKLLPGFRAPILKTHPEQLTAPCWIYVDAANDYWNFGLTTWTP